MILRSSNELFQILSNIAFKCGANSAQQSMTTSNFTQAVHILYTKFMEALKFKALCAKSYINSPTVNCPKRMMIDATAFFIVHNNFSFARCLKNKM